MSVENLEVIDFASVNKEGNVILTISDHLEWDNKKEHILLLQNKINTYLSSIESGEIYEKYPFAVNRNIVISVIAKFTPNKDGNLFIDKIKNVLDGAGYGFEFRVLESD